MTLRRSLLGVVLVVGLVSHGCLPRACAEQQKTVVDDSEVRPPVTEVDVKIVRRAREILAKPENWNRADDRKCPKGATTFSLYCALETATTELSGKFEHRGAAMQEVRFVVDELAANRNYQHRLMNYNNDPTTTLADIQKVLSIAETRIVKRLSEQKHVADGSAK